MEAVAWTQSAHPLHQAIVLVLYVAAAANAWRGYGADLIEARRRFRAGFVAGACVIGVVIALAEIALADQPAPAWLELVKLAAIAVVAGTLIAWAIELRPA